MRLAAFISRERVNVSYEIREVGLDQALRLCAESWKECNARVADLPIHYDPEWIAEHFKQGGKTVSDLDQLEFAEPPWNSPRATNKENVRAFVMAEGQEVAGVVPFVLDEQELICGLGEFRVAKFPMKILGLQSTNNMPAEVPAYDALMRQILKANPDAIYVENVRTDSFFWGYLRNSALIRRSFRFYNRNQPVPHQLIRLEGSFETYMQKFTSKTRKNRFRELRLLQERGDVQLVRVTKESEIDRFLEAAHQISKRTWQYDRGWGLRDLEITRRKLSFLARRGWLRSYLLKCGDTPVSFILGEQYHSRFYTELAGADHRWRGYSVGSVLLLRVLQDLFQENAPHFYDFGNYAKWQEYFATESYPEASAWLFSRRAYPQLTSRIYHGCNVVSMKTGAMLERLRVKSKIRELLWGRALPA